MDDRTSILISLGAATVANCVPCFEHYFRKAEALNLPLEDVREAVDIAGKVKSGAQTVMRGSIAERIGKKIQGAPSCCERSGSSCLD